MCESIKSDLYIESEGVIDTKYLCHTKKKKTTFGAKWRRREHSAEFVEIGYGRESGRQIFPKMWGPQWISTWWEAGPDIVVQPDWSILTISNHYPTVVVVVGGPSRELSTGSWFGITSWIRMDVYLSFSTGRRAPGLHRGKTLEGNKPIVFDLPIFIFRYLLFAQIL